MKKHNSYGREYSPVKAIDILRALDGGPKTAEQVGEELWPHLLGRGSSRGGPSACNYTAACQLGRLRAKGLTQWNYHGNYITK
jgi:hypothetical protein